MMENVNIRNVIWNLSRALSVMIFFKALHKGALILPVYDKDFAASLSTSQVTLSRIGQMV